MSSNVHVLSFRVHNGIEYGDMQLIGEVYDIMKHIVGLDNEEMAKLFVEWNDGILQSYLIEITAKILAKKDDLTDDGYVVDKILDKTGMKGTGKFVVVELQEMLCFIKSPISRYTFHD